MSIAEKADIARLCGQEENARAFYANAFALEKKAALEIANSDLEPTRSVLLRSAASLAMQCRAFRDAERLISLALAGSPPDEIADELRDLLEQSNFERHLELRGISLARNEIQLSIAGDDVGYGFAPTNEFVARIEDLKRIIIRTGEMQLGKPFRPAGRPDKSVSGMLENIYMSVPRAASFAVTVRLGSQETLPDFDDVKERVIEDVVGRFDLLSNGRMSELRELIGDQTYYKNFVDLATRIAPDGQRVKTVGITGFLKETNVVRKVVLSVPRIEVSQMVAEPTAEGKERVRITGVLGYADSFVKAHGVVKLKDEKGVRHTVYIPLADMEDIVRPMFGKTVEVTGLRLKDHIWYESAVPV